VKKTKIIYWSATILFAGFMLMSGISDILLEEETVQFITKLGYPVYFISFIGFAKTLGSIAILIPGFKKIKEWAYAGLIFDLIGATYSNLMVHGFDPGMLFMALIFGVAITSYIYNQKYYSTVG